MVYDVTNRPSFSKLALWKQEVDTYATNSNIVRMLVGNKIDKVGGVCVGLLCKIVFDVSAMVGVDVIKSGLLSG